MPIDSICTGCGQTLRVADEFAGRRAKCPSCGTTYLVPESGNTAEDLPRWYVRIATGERFGPVERRELDRWVQEGRVTAEASVRGEYDEHWIAAGKLYPHLARLSENDNPFAPDAAPLNPYASPSAGTIARTWHQPHRGGTVLTLAIVGLVCCQLLSPVAWALGQSDMRAINAGTMDPSGRSITQVAMVLGIVGTALLVISIVAQVLVMTVGKF